MRNPVCEIRFTSDEDRHRGSVVAVEAVVKHANTEAAVGILSLDLNLSSHVCSAPMILVGLTGGLATGKSTLADMFKRCGAVVIDADALAREVVTPGKPAWKEIVKTFGKEVLNPDRTINRQALGAIIFRDPAKRQTLERIIHPRVAREQMRLTRVAAKRDPHAVVIYDVPLLFEAGIDKRVDITIVVNADRETQIARLKKRNGLSRAEAIRRIKSQMPLAKKRQRADFVLDGTIEKGRLSLLATKTFRQLRAIA
ncbi:MAG: dephospho-CoA kinase [Nitrospira sp.]|nr:dephospho-CoA kinase [Nitrospira sp.]